MVSPNKIVGLVLVLVMMTVLFGVARTVIPTAATSYHNLSDALKGDGAIIGTDAAAFAGDTDDYLGWFWVIGPFVLAILLVVGIFLKKGRRRYR